jgi:hypothetical protein
VFLSECWINKTFNETIDGYKILSFPRYKSKTVQGGGIVILIKDIYASLVSVEEVYHDTIVWVKIDASLSSNNQDIFYAFVYLPPPNSVFYQQYQCDIFSDFEYQIAKYMLLGNVFVLGDINARTKTKDDFIANDLLHNSVINDSILTYEQDCNLITRTNPDNGSNEYGMKLLNMCKSTGLRILNGRHECGLGNEYTFNGANGMSVIDYLLTSVNCFQMINNFVINDFNEFSDHAPLYVEMEIGTQSTGAHVSEENVNAHL